MSHTNTFRESAPESKPPRGNKPNQGGGKKAGNNKAIDRLNKGNERDTLGDMEVLSQLKQAMTDSQSGEKKDGEE